LCFFIFWNVGGHQWLLELHQVMKYELCILCGYRREEHRQRRLPPSGKFFKEPLLPDEPKEPNKASRLSRSELVTKQKPKKARLLPRTICKWCFDAHIMPFTQLTLNVGITPERVVQEQGGFLFQRFIPDAQVFDFYAFKTDILMLDNKRFQKVKEYESKRASKKLAGKRKAPPQKGPPKKRAKVTMSGLANSFDM
jgi:hypothetical protein